MKNTMSRRKFVALSGSTAALAALGLAGCSSNEDDAPAGETTTLTVDTDLANMTWEQIL